MSILTPEIGKVENLHDVELILMKLREDLLRIDTGAGEPFTKILTNKFVYKISTLANEATPSVKEYSVWLTGGNTTITDFDDGEEGQIIIVIAEHSITITDGTNIFLNGSANFNMNATDTLTLICKADLKWYELARADNT